jgi:4-hydroxybenzoate polyprenyltransferase
MVFRRRIPLTQVFQIDEDRARGDHTFAVRFGPRAVFATTLCCFALALVAVLPAARSVFTPTEVALLGAALAALLVVLAWWARRYDPVARLTNHDRVLALGLVTSGCFLALILRHLIARLPS